MLPAVSLMKDKWLNTIDSSVGSGASGRFVLYPGKTNLNMVREVYSK